MCREEIINWCLRLKLALQNYNKDLRQSVSYLKPLQVQAIKSYLNNDTLVTLPTGYGKSLTYELLPYLENDCFLVVIAPVDAIIIQEISKLGQRAMKLTTQNRENIETGIVSGVVKYIFTHPETTTDKSVRRLFCCFNKKTYIVVDEAHCVQMWGEQFRPAFHSIGQLRSLFAENTIIAMTATISPSMVTNLRMWLHLATDFQHVATCPIRENLYLEMVQRPPSTGKDWTAESSYQAILDIIFSELNDSAHVIIYCTLHWCQFGYELFQRHLGDKFWVGTPDNVTAAQYHASLSLEVCTERKHYSH